MLKAVVLKKASSWHLVGIQSFQKRVLQLLPAQRGGQGRCKATTKRGVEGTGRREAGRRLT
jgi:hypothetical protein